MYIIYVYISTVSNFHILLILSLECCKISDQKDIF